MTSLVFIVLSTVLSMSFLNNFINSQWGALKAKIELPNGAPVAGAIVELWRDEIKTQHCGTSLDSGIVQIRRITPGEYILKIRAPGHAVITRSSVRILAGDETDIGNVRLGNEGDCNKPGVFCDDFSSWAGKIELPCVSRTRLYRYSDGSVEVISSDDLKERVIRRYLPDWPEDSLHGREIKVYLVIGTSGTVLCSGVAGKPDATETAILEAVQKWQFRPFYRKGSAVSVMGILDIAVP